jgi:hypothetical protein
MTRNMPSTLFLSRMTFVCRFGTATKPLRIKKSSCFASTGKGGKSGACRVNPPMSAKKACCIVQLLISALWKSFTDCRADTHWPAALRSVNSGPRKQRQVSQTLRWKMWMNESSEDETFRQRIDHEQRNIVNAQLQIMSIVPRAFGELVQPCLRGNVAFRVPGKLDSLLPKCEVERSDESTGADSVNVSKKV